MKLKTFGKILAITGITFGTAFGALTAFYIKGLPYIVSHPKTISYAQDTVKKYTNADLKIENPVLHTEFSPNKSTSFVPKSIVLIDINGILASPAITSAV